MTVAIASRPGGPARFLFAMFQGGGNIPLILPIAAELVARGHAVRVLAGPGIRGGRLPVSARFRERIAPADVLVADHFLPGALVAAEAARVPSAVLVHGFYKHRPAPGLPPYSTGFLPARGPVGRLR